MCRRVGGVCGVHVRMGMIIMSWSVSGGVCLMSGILCGKRALCGLVSLGAVRVSVVGMYGVVCMWVHPMLRGVVRAHRMVRGDARIRNRHLLGVYHVAVADVHRRTTSGVRVGARCHLYMRRGRRHAGRNRRRGLCAVRSRRHSSAADIATRGVDSGGSGTRVRPAKGQSVACASGDM